MSVATARTARSASPARPQVAPRAGGSLRLVPQSRTTAPRTPFVVVVVCLLTIGLLGLLVLNTVLAQDAFRVHSLTTEGRVLAEREQVLQREVEGMRTPRSLAGRAAELGMVPAGPPAFLMLPEGRVLGAELPALAPEPPPAPVAPDTEADAEASTDPDADPPADADPLSDADAPADADTETDEGGDE